MGCFSGSESKSESTSYRPSQGKALDKAIELYLPFLGQNNNVWQGDRLAGFGDLQTNAIGAGSNFLNLFSNPMNIANPLLGETGDSLNMLLSGLGGAEKMTQGQVDDYYNNAFVKPAMSTLQNDLLPSVDEGYAGTNFFNSARGKARDRVITDVAEGLNTTKANLDFNNTTRNQQLDEAAAGRMQNAVNQGMNYTQLPGQIAGQNLNLGGAQLKGLEELFGLGQKEQLQSQAQIEAAIQKFAQENQITDPENLSILLSLIGMNMNSSSGSSSGPGLGYSMLSGNSGGITGSLEGLFGL